MKKLFRTLIVLISVALIAIGAHVLFLFYLSPSEKYSYDSYLDTEKNKNALILVAHDDDALLFCGTTSKLIAQGWNINFLCFYNSIFHPKDTPIRKLEVEKIKTIEGLKTIDLIDFDLRKKSDTIKLGWWPIPVNLFSEVFNVDSLKFFIQNAINKYKPSVIFILDNYIGYYGNPEHVLVGKVVEEICLTNKDSIIFPVKKIYMSVMPPSQTNKILGKTGSYIMGKQIYQCNGMPIPDVQIDISSVGEKKKNILLAQASQYRTVNKYIPAFKFYPYWMYFNIFDKEYFTIIDIKK